VISIKHKAEVKKHSKEFIIVLVQTGITMIGTLVLLKILSNTLSREEFGTYSLILSIMAFIMIFPYKGIDQSIARYVSINRNDGTFSEFYSNYILLFLLTSLTYLLFFILLNVLNVSLGVFTEYLWTVFAFLITEVGRLTLRIIVKADRKRVEILVSNIIEFGLKISLVVLLSGHLTVNLVFVIFIVANLLSSINLFVENKKEVKVSTLNKENFLSYSKILLLFAYPFIIMAIFGWLRDISNRWVIDFYLDRESVAIYTMLTTISLIIPLGIQTVLGSFINPIVYQKENTQKGFAKMVANKIFLFLPGLLFITSIFVYLYSSEIVILFSNADYIYNSWALTCMFLAFSVYIVSELSVLEIVAHKKSKKIVFPTVVSGVVSILSGVLLIRLYGLDGAIYSYMIGYISYAILIFFTLKKYRAKNAHPLIYNEK